MVIRQDGNVGIGTTTPASTFSIENRILFNEGGGSTAAGPDIKFASARNVNCKDK